MKTTKKDVKFWCAVGTVKQGAFRENGSTYTVDKESPIGEQHILYQSVLMCGKSRDGIKKYRKTKKQKTVQLRIENVPLCKECEKKYKANSNLLYVKWALSVEEVTKAVIVEPVRKAAEEVFGVDLHGVTAS